MNLETPVLLTSCLNSPSGEANMTRAVFAAPFDPIHYGHLDIAVRAAKLFERLYIGIYDNPAQTRYLFTTTERLKMAKESIGRIPNVEVQAFNGMVADYAESVGAKTLVRALRVTSDFEREFEKALLSKKMYPELELVCMMSARQYQFLSSRMLKDVAMGGGDLSGLVPENVAGALKQKVLERKSLL
jgi:pantetheine-phosphate adenylyltransferase